jgi:hypothetical protein
LHKLKKFILIYLLVYGKLALKFETFYNRWLEIVYPREISNSFEEKNRLLQKLSSTTSTSAAVEAAAAENDSLLDEDNQSNNQSNDNNTTNENENENEPEYITKRTSFGRLVKMKVSTEYDYESDQDENKKQNKKRKNKYYSDDEFIANGKPRSDLPRGRPKKYTSDDDDDDDSFGKASDDDYNSNDNESLNGSNKKIAKTRGRKRKPRNDELLNNSDENTTSTNDGTMKVSKKLTFDQYVKILTGNNNPTTTTATTTTTTSTPTSSTAAVMIKNINIDKLKVPIINPVVAAVLEANKIRQQQQQQLQNDNDESETSNLNVDNLSKSIKIIAMPNSKILSPNINGSNKKLIILNGNASQQTTMSSPTNLNLFKIVNLSQPITTVVKTQSPVITQINKATNRQIIVINNQQNVNKQQQNAAASSPVQILANNSSLLSTQLIKITTNQNSQPNIQTITKLTPVTTKPAEVATNPIVP